MNTIEIISLALKGVGALASLSSSLLVANQETSKEIQQKMLAELDAMRDLFALGGAMDQAFAAKDSKTDAVIAEIEEKKEHQ